LNDIETAGLSFGDLLDVMGRFEGSKTLKTLLEFRRTKTIKGKELIGFEELSAAARESDAFKIEKAFNDVKLKITEAFTPARLKSFASGMKDVVDVIGSGLKFLEGWVGTFRIIGERIRDIIGLSDKPQTAAELDEEERERRRIEEGSLAGYVRRKTGMRRLLPEEHTREQERILNAQEAVIQATARGDAPDVIAHRQAIFEKRASARRERIAAGGQAFRPGTVGAAIQRVAETQRVQVGIDVNVNQQGKILVDVQQEREARKRP
jgi:hypothetical protein